MPELPEVETTCRGIRPHIVGKNITNVIVRNNRLRWPVSDKLQQILSETRILAVKRRAKYILLECQHGTLIIHLGMSGNLRICPIHLTPQKHDHVDICFSDICLRYQDPRRFGAILWITGEINQHALFNHLGPEPLSDAFDAKYLHQQAIHRKIPVKSFIMDASIIVGVGNIYANEALFASGIHPKRSANRISIKRYTVLVNNIKSILTQAIEQGGTTLKDFVNEQGKPGYFAQQLKVYGKSGDNCPVCSRAIKTIKIGQRSTFFCTNCQR